MREMREEITRDTKRDWKFEFEAKETDGTYGAYDSLPRYRRSINEAFCIAEEALRGFFPDSLDEDAEWVLTKVSTNGIVVYEEGDDLGDPYDWVHKIIEGEE